MQFYNTGALYCSPGILRIAEAVLLAGEEK